MLTRQVLTKFTADASGHIAATKAMARDNEKLQSSLADMAKKVDGWFGAIDGGMERSKRVFADVRAVLEGFDNAHTAYVSKTTKLAALHGVELARLDKAAAGTRSQMALLSDAAKLQGGIFKVSGAEIEKIILAERALAREGHDLEQVHQALNEAWTKGTVDGLRPFGIAIDTAGASMADASGRAKIHNALLAEMTRLSGDSSLAIRNASEERAAAAAKDANSLDSIKNSMGSLVDAMKPLRSVASDALGGVAALIDQITNATRRQSIEAARLMGIKIANDQYANASGVGKLELAQIALGSHIAKLSGYDPRVLEMTRTGGAFEQIFSLEKSYAKTADGLAADQAKAKEILAAANANAPKAAAAKAMGGGGASAAAVRSVQQSLAALSNALAADIADTGVYGAALMPGLGSAAGYADVFGIDIGKASGDAILTERWKSELEAFRGKDKSFMESTFGKVGEIDGYRLAFEGLTGSVTAGYNAMVDGTMSFGNAFKASMAQAVKSLGSVMLVEAMKEGAYALAALARGIGGDARQFAAAATHGKAALAFGAGAAAAGLVANAMGTGASGGGGAGAGAAAPGPRPSNSSGGSSIVYVIGDPFDTEVDPRRRQANAERVLQRVAGNRAGGQY